MDSLLGITFRSLPLVNSSPLFDTLPTTSRSLITGSSPTLPPVSDGFYSFLSPCPILVPVSRTPYQTVRHRLDVIYVSALLAGGMENEVRGSRERDT